MDNEKKRGLRATINPYDDPCGIFDDKGTEIMTNVIEDDDGEESPGEVMLDRHRAMVELPENAVEVEMKCKVYHDGELISVSKVMDLSGLREAFRKADDGYIDEDDRFELTDKGRELLKEMMEESYD